jgi:hypothetical protein
MSWLPDDSKHLVLCVQFCQEVARHVWYVVVSKAYQYHAVGSGSKLPERTETCVNII